MSEAKLKVHEETKPTAATPSEEFIARGFQPTTLPYEDKEGRTHSISVREPSILAEFQLIEALGDVAENQTYMRMVMPLIYLGSIDGEEILPPMSKLEVEALIQRLERPGLGALMGWWMENVNKAMADAEAQAKAKAKLKN